MRCYRCCGETRVVDTIDITTDKAYSVRRRRRCTQCDHQFHTSELVYKGPRRSTLTMEQVSSIRKLKAQYPDLKQKALAEKFGVTQPAISRVLSKTRWPAFSGRG